MGDTKRANEFSARTIKTERDRKRNGERKKSK